MLIFRNADLRPVLTEALTNSCRLILAKDHGVYLLSDVREKNLNGNAKYLAYAAGCNPDVDPVDECWERITSILGGDDFGEYFNPQADVFVEVLHLGKDLELRSTVDGLFFQAVSPDQEVPPLLPKVIPSFAGGMALKGRLEDYTEVEFLALLNGICNFECQDEETHSIWVEHFVRVSQHPKGSDLIFWPEDDDDSSPEGILNAVKEWRASNDLPGFYEGEPSSAKSVETPR